MSMPLLCIPLQSPHGSKFIGRNVQQRAGKSVDACDGFLGRAHSLNPRRYKQNKSSGDVFAELLDNTSGLHRCANREWDVLPSFS